MTEGNMYSDSEVKKGSTKGTKEWADSNVNCYYGCSNDCRYCYARNMAFRFKRIEKYEDWKVMKPNIQAINKGYKKRKGRIMFPTSHDITYEKIATCHSVLHKLLEAGNEILITTKPDIRCIEILCNSFEMFKEQIQFRFTIGSCDDSIITFWEPKAPSYESRIQSLQYAFEKGYKTSVSIEPFLDPDLTVLINEISPFITETIWIGSMSSLGNVIGRSIWEISQIPHDPTKKHPEVQEIRERIKEIYEINQLSHIEKMIEVLNGLSLEIRDKIRLKDSIRNLGLEIKTETKLLREAIP